MHDLIIQISEQPITKDEWMTSSVFQYDDCRFIGIEGDYVYNTEDREQDIERLRSVLPITEDETLVITDELKREYFQSKHESFLKALRDLNNAAATLEDFISLTSSFDHAMWELNGAHEAHQEVYVYTDDNEPIPLDRFMRGAEVNKPYYIGGVVGYHW